MGEISKLHNNLRNGSTTAVATVQTFLDRIKTNNDLNAFLQVFEVDALNRAIEIDNQVGKGEFRKLTGVVIALKDNIVFEEHEVSASSKILEGFESLYSATIVKKLLAEGAIIIGRTNCDEFAMGSSNENSAFGNVLNPLDRTRVTGGSSGGSAAAVAADLCHISLGSDTGGSIRQPASFCGVIGVKPTYGRVSRYGLIAYASSFDQIGPFAKSMDDAALVTEVISGADEFDATCSSKPVEAYSSVSKLEGKKRFAYLKQTIEMDGLDPEVKAGFMAKTEQLKAEGHEVNAVDFPYLDQLVPTYYVLTTAEASSNLSRFDGMRYGYRSDKAHDLESTYKLSRTEGFGAEVKRRIMLGTFVLSAGYYDAYYGKGQKVRRLVSDKVDEIFRENDFIISPTTPDVAFKFGANTDDPIKMYLEDIYTVMANITGIPAISFPIGSNSEGLPFSMQVMAPKFKESEAFSASISLA
jgi:aspartyl-tRNA(Asn)/glutamyl-tRNA(Gln) amidotransferase subunit A